MRSYFLRAIVAGAAFALAAASQAADVSTGAVDNAVAQIIVESQAPNWFEPWRPGTTSKGTGSGFVIKGRRLLTNAHVVSWAREIYVKRTRDNEAYPARVTFIAHDCDLAILEISVGAEKFFADTTPLEFSGLPEPLSPVFVCGYPAGGNRISVTRGVVSRIDVQRYAHTGTREHLTVQIDAAINPGNSGGPVIQNGAVVGVAFQGFKQLENTGYVIPGAVVGRFLKDVEDGVYHGVVIPEFTAAPLKNKAERDLRGSPRADEGVLVDSFLPGARMSEYLRTNDVIYRVGATVIATDGSALFGANRLPWSHALLSAQSGETVEFEILRAGKVQTLRFPVFPYQADAAQGMLFNAPPRYCVYGGLVFTPLSRDYLAGAGQRGMVTELLYQLYDHAFEHPDERRPEPVVFSHVLPHAVNADLTVTGMAVVDRLNGVRVTCMEDLERGFAAAKGNFHFFEFTNGQFECLDKAAADKAQREILDQYGVMSEKRLVP